MKPDEEFEFNELMCKRPQKLGFPLVRIQSAKPELLRRVLPVAGTWTWSRLWDPPLYSLGRLGACTHLAFNMHGHIDPSEWLEIMPEVLNVHAKFYDADEDGQEPAIDYPTRARVVAEGGYRGYQSSDWKWPAFADPGDVDPLLPVRKKDDLIRPGSIQLSQPDLATAFLPSPDRVTGSVRTLVVSGAVLDPEGGAPATFARLSMHSMNHMREPQLATSAIRCMVEAS
jgi:hypothetical protein